MEESDSKLAFAKVAIQLTQMIGMSTNYRCSRGRHPMDTVTINRAPVLTLWAAVVAECLGFDPDEALTLGKAVAGLTAQSKGQRLGIFTPSPEAVRKERAKKATATGVLRVALLGRAVAVLRTDFGLRAVDKDQKPMAPTSVAKIPAVEVWRKTARSAGCDGEACTVPGT